MYFSNSRCISWNQIKNIFVWIRKVLIDIKNAFLYCTQINLFKSKNIYVHLRSRCGRESAGPCVLIGEAYLRRTGRKWEREGTKPEKNVIPWKSQFHMSGARWAHFSSFFKWEENFLPNMLDLRPANRIGLFSQIEGEINTRRLHIIMLITAWNITLLRKH